MFKSRPYCQEFVLFFLHLYGSRCGEGRVFISAAMAKYGMGMNTWVSNFPESPVSGKHRCHCTICLP